MIPKKRICSLILNNTCNLVSKDEKSIIENLVASQKVFDDVLRNLPVEKHNFSYAEGKWTIKELIQHIIDTERVFSLIELYVLLEMIILLCLDLIKMFLLRMTMQNDRNYYDLLNEMEVLRKSSIQLFKSFSDEALLRVWCCFE